ncbi:MAG: ATP-dependent helicase, partial [Acidimicrobiales bacterium]
PLCVLAGAGSGKTTVLTRRVARRVLDGSADVEHTLVVTFTRKAATELRSRMARLGVSGQVWAGTFHAAAYGQLRRYWADHDVRPRALLDEPARLLQKILGEPSGDEGGVHVMDGTPRSPGVATGLVAAVAAEVHWAQVSLVTPKSFAQAARRSGRTIPMAFEQVAQAYARYGEEKRRRGLVDLDDLIDDCARLLENDEEAAAAQRWRIRHLFVDEFQDLNPAQWRLLQAWLGGRGDLFVVGDPRQAVYGWNGADPTLIQRLPELLPETSVLHLDQNHRSSPQIVAAARAVSDASTNSDARPSSLGTVSSNDGSPVCDPAGTDRPDGPAPVVVAFDTDESEAIAVARWLRQAHRPGRIWSQLAVLARTNSRLESVATVLRRTGIPYRITTPAASASRADLDTLRDALSLLRAQPADRPLRSALAEVVVCSEEGDRPEGPLGDPSTERESSRGLPPELARQTDEVDLMTFHKAKGLEWRAVAVVGLEDGIVPIAYALTSEALAEERRLLYVAMTRAEEELWCSWSSSRRARDRIWACNRSPFLDAVEAAVRAARPTNDLESRRARVADLRARLLAVG